MIRRPVPPAIALSLAAGAAEAHVSSGGIVDSYGGLLHPFTEPLHVLTLLGLGFLLMTLVATALQTISAAGITLFESRIAEHMRAGGMILTAAHQLLLQGQPGVRTLELH